MLEAYIQVWNLGYYEVKEAFRELADEHVWKRPAEGILSIGEVTGHTAYWEAVMHAGEEAGVADSDSPLVDRRFRYYTETIATPPSEEQRAMTAQRVCEELVRVHELAVAKLNALHPDLDDPVPGAPYQHTYGDLVRYKAFHIAYHTGQIYTVRHLLGEVPPDN